MEIIIISSLILIIGIIIGAFTDWDNPLGPMLILFSVLFLGGSIIGYIGSSKTAKFINNKYGTNYTTQDIFWNERLIMSELKLDNKVIDNSSKLKIELEQK